MSGVRDPRLEKPRGKYSTRTKMGDTVKDPGIRAYLDLRFGVLDFGVYDVGFRDL